MKESNRKEQHSSDDSYNKMNDVNEYGQVNNYLGERHQFKD